MTDLSCSSVRSEDDLTTLLNLPHGRTRRGPLITFWTASFDQQGRTVAEELKSIIESETGSIGNEGDGVGFVEVETDAVTATELAPRYMVGCKVPMYGQVARANLFSDRHHTHLDGLQKLDG